ncbi:hypothetical protein [Bradyrhizobium liaoningense]|uniref:hypothetical protein n=1 Tax=Bradyrhizobium liaoningense TaxID=43992 RepID=UPI001BAB3213|nr:hypothetical protein [Bradyrhizobium liaoningense]MBR0714457.1 hypothetical protein [Bradyrhizobium liaoningense]
MTTRILSIILAILIAFFIVTNAAPTVLVVLVLFTFGVGLPLLYANTALIYLLAAAPALILMRSTPRNWRLIALAAIPLPVVVIGVPLLAETLTARHMQHHLSGDVSGSFAETPRSVELVSVAQYYADLSNPPKSAGCDTLCQRLLLSRRVDIVRVTRKTTERSVEIDHVIEQRDTCPEAFGPNEVMLPETKDALVSGICFISRVASAEQMMARIEIENSKFPEPQNLGQDFARAVSDVRSLQVLKISAPSPGGWSLKLQKTQVIFSHWMMPLNLFYAPCYGVCIGAPVFMRSERTLNSFDLVAIALQTLGIDNQKPNKLFSPADRVVTMLDRAGERLTDNQKQLVTDWVISLQCQNGKCPFVAGKDAEVLLKLVQDRRVRDFRLMDNIIGRSRDVVVDHLDLFLDQMEARSADSNFSGMVGTVIGRLDSKDLSPRGERILALIMSSDWRWVGGIGAASGRLGIDTTQLISERLRWLEASKTAALAACRADVAIGQKLVPVMLEYLRARPVSDGTADQAARYVTRGLARFGHADEARQILLDRYPKLDRTDLPPQNTTGIVPDMNVCGS